MALRVEPEGVLVKAVEGADGGLDHLAGDGGIGDVGLGDRATMAVPAAVSVGGGRAVAEGVGPKGAGVAVSHGAS